MSRAIQAALLFVWWHWTPVLAGALEDGPPSPLSDATLKAALSGEARAQHRACRAYFFGIGAPANEEKALLMCRKAAHQGLGHAQMALAELYMRGTAVARDPGAAIRWYRSAAHAGVAHAQYRLGSLKLSGRGVERDSRAGLRWMRKAARGGHVGAMADMGLLYALGTGVERDCGAALKWFQRAADAGDDVSRNNVARVLAVCPERRYRDGTRAVRIAQGVIADNGDPPSRRSLDTLAAAYAEAGVFDKAVAVQQRAIDRLAPDAPPALARAMGERLRAYREHIPWRGMQPAVSPW